MMEILAKTVCKNIILQKKFRHRCLAPCEIAPCFLCLKVQSCKIYNNKHMIASIQITNTGIFVWTDKVWGYFWNTWVISAFLIWMTVPLTISAKSSVLKLHTFLIKLHWAYNLNKKETGTQLFSYESCKILKTPFLIEYVRCF